MCGVSGFWLSRPIETVEGTALLRRLTSTLAHRGPDSAGHSYDHRTGVGLGHRRLSIVDLSETGAQPMSSASRRYQIVFNGEVYNYGELRQELDTRERIAWRGTSDTEVMLELIERDGLDGALRKFSGMFAFALFDTHKRLLHLVRDRFGVKPLYWAQTASGLCFGSELKALTPFPGFESGIDRQALASFLLRGYVSCPKSIYSGAQKIEPGHYLTFSSHQSAPKRTRWWSAAESIVSSLSSPWKATKDEAVEALDEALRRSVRLRMVADVPVGAFLSGGVDSSTVVALMQAVTNSPVSTYSIANESAAWDEAPAAARVAKHLGTRHSQLVVTPKDAMAVIPELPRIYDEPFADSSQIPTYLVSRLARRDVTVALSGDGGDEFFGGYNRHVWGPAVWYGEAALPNSLRTNLAGAIRGRSAAEWDGFFERMGKAAPRMRLPGLRMHKLAGLLEAHSLDDLYRSMTTQWEHAPLLDPADDAMAWDRRLFWKEPPLDGVSHQFMYRDTVGYLADDILTKVDRATMAVSLEGREPLLDHRVFELAWRMPARWKARAGHSKHLLRRVLERYVPTELIEGPKMGFGVPIGDWLRSGLREWGEELLSEKRLQSEGLWDVVAIRQAWDEHQTGSRPNEHRLWNVLMFQAWADARRAQREEAAA